VPARLERYRRLAHPPIRFSPTEINPQNRVHTHLAEAEVEIGTPLARMAASAVDLGYEPATVRQVHGGDRTDGRPARDGAAERPGGDGGRLGHILGDREAQTKAQERPHGRTLISEEHRRRPLVSDQKVEVAVTVDIGCSDAAADTRARQP
jgi:hypothetical protein